MTLIADSKKRVVIPGAAPGDVFAVSETPQGLLVKRVYQPRKPAKRIKQQVLEAIKKWKARHRVQRKELRKTTRKQ
jgi:hypothetical protein